MLPVPSALYPTHGVVVTEAISTAAMVGDIGEGGSMSFDVQMFEELFGHPLAPVPDLSFATSGAAPVSSSIVTTTGVPSAAQLSREEEILAEISAEMAKTVTVGPDGDAVPSSLSSLMMISPGGTVIVSSVAEHVSVTAPMPSVRPHKRISIPSSSEEDVDIMPEPEDVPKKGKKSRMKPGSGSSGSTPRKKHRRKKE